MSSPQLRKKKGKADKDSIIASTDIDREDVSKIVKDKKDLVDTDKTVPESQGIVKFVKSKLYLNVFYPVWSHLDERGFGTWQPFVCWLVIPFTLSMIVWYVAVCQLYEISRWEDYMDPLTDYSSLEQEEFVWGEL